MSLSGFSKVFIEYSVQKKHFEMYLLGAVVVCDAFALPVSFPCWDNNRSKNALKRVLCTFLGSSISSFLFLFFSFLLFLFYEFPLLRVRAFVYIGYRFYYITKGSSISFFFCYFFLCGFLCLDCKYILSPLSIIGDLSVFFFGFCFEKFFHRPCVTYGKSENHMH